MFEGRSAVIVGKPGVAFVLSGLGGIVCRRHFFGGVLSCVRTDLGSGLSAVGQSHNRQRRLRSAGFGAAAGLSELGGEGYGSRGMCWWNGRSTMR